MPSKFNGETTKSLAKILTDNLWIRYIIDPIQESVDLSVKRIEKSLWKKSFFEAPIEVIKEIISNKWKRKKYVNSFNLENIQARERWKTLSDNVPYFWPFTNNWNKDEVLTWYATLYGDVNWVLAVIWDLHKTQVWDLCRWINKNYGEIIPEKMIEMKPAAELSDEQNVDNWWWDPFDYKFLWALETAYYNKKQTIFDIIEKISDNSLETYLWLEKWYLENIFWTKEKTKDEAKRVWRLKTISYFKRVQSPPIITISKSSAWFDHREAQNKVYNWERKVA
jgi:NAD+ synthase (glutamine-hydrolysing)